MIVLPVKFPGAVGAPAYTPPAETMYRPPARQILFAWLPDGGDGTTRATNTQSIYGGSQNLAVGDSLTWDNVILGPGDTLKLLHYSITTTGTASFDHAGDAVGDIDTSRGSALTNQRGSFVVSSGDKAALERGTLTVTAVDSDISIQAICIVSAGGVVVGSADLRAWRKEIPIQAYDSSTAALTRAATTSRWWGEYIAITSTIGTGTDYKIDLPQGTWEMDLVYTAGAAGGIVEVTLGGVSLGTIDCYNATTIANTVATLSGISVATDAVQTLNFSSNTKNASSSNYQCNAQGIQFRRTA